MKDSSRWDISQGVKTFENSMNKDFLWFLGTSIFGTFLLYVETWTVSLDSYTAELNPEVFLNKIYENFV